MKLHWSPRSPFVRKVMIAAHELGLAERIETVRTVVALAAPNADLIPDNPMSKIPTLVLDDGTVLFDSLVICAYFDELAGGGRLLPREGMARWDALTRHAVANALLDMLLLWRQERERPPEGRKAANLDAFAVKYRATLARMEADAAYTDGFGLVAITTGIALAYLDFRLPDLEWRRDHPRLRAWFETFDARPSARATQVVDG